MCGAASSGRRPGGAILGRQGYAPPAFFLGRVVVDRPCPRAVPGPSLLTSALLQSAQGLPGGRVKKCRCFPAGACKPLNHEGIAMARRMQRTEHTAPQPGVYPKPSDGELPMPASTPRKPGAEPLVEESRTAPVAALAAGEAIAMLQAARDLIVQLALMAAQDDRGGATVTVYVESSRNSATRGRTRCFRGSGRRRVFARHRSSR